MTNFYYNANVNMCADEEAIIYAWVSNGIAENREEAIEKMEQFGWKPCLVSESIESKFY